MICLDISMRKSLINTMKINLNFRKSLLSDIIVDNYSFV